MTVLGGRSVFIVDAPVLIHRLGTPQISAQATRAHLKSVWIRIGRGQVVQPGLVKALARQLGAALEKAGVELWGWHVPFAGTDDAAQAEVDLVLSWARDFELAGVITDAERTHNPPRFQGGAAQARLYATYLAAGLAADQKGFAFSSHDQPSLHRDLPFAEFLSGGGAALPQVYGVAADPGPRLGRSEADYRPLLGADFAARYMPTANASMVGEGGFPDEATCKVRFDLPELRTRPEIPRT